MARAAADVASGWTTLPTSESCGQTAGRGATLDSLGGGPACFFNDYASNVRGNVLHGNGSFGQPTNGDLVVLPVAAAEAALDAQPVLGAPPHYRLVCPKTTPALIRAGPGGLRQPLPPAGGVAVSRRGRDAALPFCRHFHPVPRTR